MIKKSGLKKILIGLSVILFGIVFFDIFFLPFNTPVLNNTNLEMNKISFNLKLLNKYNTPKEPISSNFRNFFNGDYSSSEYSIIKYNIVSSLFLLIVPIFFMLGVLLFLEVSFKITVIVMAIFGVFTVLPLFLV
jgi:hypothetical protein